MEENNKDSPNLMSEPSVAYKNVPIQTFHSFEAANEADAKLRASLTPIQHLINVTNRIKEMYADELKKPMNKTLKFSR